jgi:hypothetical protein
LVRWLFGVVFIVKEMMSRDTWIFYGVAILTSAWLWAYVASAQVMRLLACVPRFLHALSKVADIKEHPVRVLGFVAALITAAGVAVLSIFI